MAQFAESRDSVLSHDGDSERAGRRAAHTLARSESSARDPITGRAGRSRILALFADGAYPRMPAGDGIIPGATMLLDSQKSRFFGARACCDGTFYACPGIFLSSYAKRIVEIVVLLIGRIESQRGDKMNRVVLFVLG